jgi:hypothetical protein
MTDSDQSHIEPPSISSWLQSYLSVKRAEYESQFDEGNPSDELTNALNALERHAAELVLTGVISQELSTQLEQFQPGDPARTKLKELLRYQIVHHRLELDVAEDAVARLADLDDRVNFVAILTILLLGYTPSQTAVKFLRRATTLYLAGYETESIIMCGAVLEAALRARFPDEQLTAAGIRPIFKRTGDYSLAQRLRFEEDHPIFSEDDRARIRDVVSWRNDSVHVQPDVSPSADQAFVHLVMLLPVLFPAPDA